MTDELKATIVMIAEYRLNPGTRDAFIALMRDYARATLEELDGFQQFDVLVGEDEPDQAFVYEVFQDLAAYQDYAASDRVPGIREAYKDMVIDRRIVKCSRRR